MPSPYLYVALRLMPPPMWNPPAPKALDMKPRDFDARPEHARKQMQALHA